MIATKARPPILRPAKAVQLTPPPPPAKGKGKGKGAQPQIANLGRGFAVDPGTFTRVDISLETSRAVVSTVLAIDFHNVLDRIFIQHRSGRKEVQQQAYPHHRPALLPQVVSWLVEIAQVCNRNSILLVLLSRIGLRSEAIESHALTVLRNTTQDCSSDLFDLWIVTRYRTERGGKLSTLKELFPNAAGFGIVDDNTNIIQEFTDDGQRGFHVRLPKRDGVPSGRSYQNIYELTSDLKAWIVENGGEPV